MSAKQFDVLMGLMEEYSHNMPEHLAERREEQIKKANRNIQFAWSGGINTDDPHYYRVQSAFFLIEFDDTQDGANHIHSVWRDLSGDFGEDLLKLHYEIGHQRRQESFAMPSRSAMESAAKA